MSHDMKLHDGRTVTVTDKAKCQSCAAPVVWAITDKGQRIPLNPDPVPGGNLALTGQKPLTAFYWTPSLFPDRFGDPVLYHSHFVTCPDAALHRSNRKKAPRHD